MLLVMQFVAAVVMNAVAFCVQPSGRRRGQSAVPRSRSGWRLHSSTVERGPPWRGGWVLLAEEHKEFRERFSRLQSDILKLPRVKRASTRSKQK
jgi:hypothetical protein